MQYLGHTYAKILFVVDLNIQHSGFSKATPFCTISWVPLGVCGGKVGRNEKQEKGVGCTVSSPNPPVSREQFP